MRVRKIPASSTAGVVVSVTPLLAQLPGRQKRHVPEKLLTLVSNPSFREARAATRAGRRRGTTTTCVRVARTLVFFVFCCLHKRANHFLSFYAFVQQGVVSGVILRGGDSTIVERAGLRMVHACAPCFRRTPSTSKSRALSRSSTTSSSIHRRSSSFVWAVTGK